MSRPGELAGDQLRTIVERIERIEEEIEEPNEGKREIFFEAKSNGLDVKIIRQVIKIRKQNQEERDQQETLLEAYLQAIGSSPPVSKTAGRRVASKNKGSRRSPPGQEANSAA